MTLLLLGVDPSAPPAGPGWLYELYAQGMRNSLFTGFLTLCGFLLAAKTFIVVNMKKEVYDRESYQQNFRLQRRLNPNLKLYGPLERLAWSLTWNVGLALATSVCQFTIGLIPSPLSALVCLLLAAVTLVFLGISLYRIRNNLRLMFQWIEVEAKKAEEGAGVSP